MIRSRIILALVLLPLMAGAQTPRLTLKEADKLVPRQVLKPVKSMIPAEVPSVYDTLDTSDPAVKLLLMNDGTWRYERDITTLADSAVFRKAWKTNEINPYIKCFFYNRFTTVTNDYFFE